MLGLDFAGDYSGEYGALTITGSASLDGGLGLDLTGGFTPAKGDSFDILAFGSLRGLASAQLSLDGAACMMRPIDSWACGGGVRLTEISTRRRWTSFVAHASAGFGPAARPPRTSTWAMMLLGFLGLGGLGLRKRGRAAAS